MLKCQSQKAENSGVGEEDTIAVFESWQNSGDLEWGLWSKTLDKSDKSGNVFIVLSLKMKQCLEKIISISLALKLSL